MSDTVSEATGVHVPAAPLRLEDTGLTAEAVADLILKILYVQGAQTGQQLARTICLPFDIVDERLAALQSRRFVEVIRTTGPARGSYVFDVAGPGRQRATDAIDASQYVGPAPVPLNDYRTWLERQSIRTVHAGREQIRRSFSHLVLPEDVLEALGPAINSASSLFLHGDPGNGKTVISEAIAHLLGGDLYIPFAVDVGGSVMVLFDPVHHQAVEQALAPGASGEEPWLSNGQDFDRRFVRVKRPVIFAGGELSLEQLDLQYDEFTKTYQAPFQLKAGGGLLVIDDFGRQLVPPRDLLNRWIVPLEKRVDFLTLHTGVKFPVPFDCLLVFATNLNPHELVDEAFLRRIQYKINVPSPDPEAYRLIFRQESEANGIRYDPAAVDYVYDNYYDLQDIPPRACHPRDIIDHMIHAARYEQREPRFTLDLLERACHSYFLVVAPNTGLRSREGTP